MHTADDTQDPWPPPLPESQGFVAPPVPTPLAAARDFLRAIIRDPSGGGRVVVRSLGLIALGLTCIPAHILWRLLGAHSPWAQWFLAGTSRLCGIRITVIGEPIRHDVFFISNHLSWTDALILGGVTGAVFVAQDGIARWPILCALCKLNDTIFITRSDRMGVIGQINEMRKQFLRHRKLVLFPEGTCGDGRRLLPFKAPLFAMMTPAPPGAVLQAVVIDCDEAGRELAWLGMETGAENSWRLLARRGSWEARVHFLAPLDPSELGDRKTMAGNARAMIAAKLSETLGGRPIL